MKIIKELTILLISILYITVGLNHFIKPNFFLEIVPPIIPFKLEVVFISGFFEIILGALILFKKTRKLASLLIIVLLVVVFPANIYLYISETPRLSLNITKSQALFRMPFQLSLIISSYWHSRDDHSKTFSIISIILFIPTIIYFITL